MDAEAKITPGTGECEPKVVQTTFWYLNASAKLVSGTRTITANCAPAVTTTVYTDASGAVLATPPTAVTVEYVVAASDTSSTGVVTAAPTIIVTETPELGCASGVGYTRISRNIWSDGVIVSSAAIYRNAAGTEVGTAPVGFTLGECPASTAALAPKALTGVGIVTITPPDALVWSITVTREANTVQYSLNSGGSWFTMNANGSRTWSSTTGRMLNASTMRFRGTAAASRFDVIWEV
jgi:hypothetical protein